MLYLFRTSHHNRITTRPTVHQAFGAFLFRWSVCQLGQLLMAALHPRFRSNCDGSRHEKRIGRAPWPTEDASCAPPRPNGPQKGRRTKVIAKNSEGLVFSHALQRVLEGLSPHTAGSVLKSIMPNPMVWSIIEGKHFAILKWPHLSWRFGQIKHLIWANMAK